MAHAPHAARRATLWRNGDFLRLWAGQSVSRLGSEVSLVAIPLTAVLVLQVDAFQAGLLGALEFLPFLLVGLPAGAIVDRLPRRPILVLADLGRALSFGSIPVAAALGHLTLLHLYAAALAGGVLTVFFDVAYQSYLPALVTQAELIEGNAKLELSNSAAMVGGPGIGGALAAALGAPRAIALDALSYVWSVVLLLLIRRREELPARPPAQTRLLASLRTEIGEGLAYVFSHPLIRPTALCTATWNLFSHVGFVITVLFAVRELGLGAATIGGVFAAGALGNVAGAAVCSPVSRRLGVGRSIVLGLALSPGMFLIPLATRATAIPMLIAAGFLSGLGGVLYNVNQVSLRQAITPARLLGRLNASVRFAVWGTIPVGSLLGGLLGGLIGLRPTLFVAAIGSTLAGAWVVASPVARLRTIDDAMPPRAAAPTASVGAAGNLAER